MKKALIISGILISFMILATQAKAQVNPRFGYIDSNELLEAMPGKDTIETALQEYGQSLEGQLQAMYQEYQAKVSDYQANSATMSTIIRQTKERELADMETRIQEFQQQADVDLQNKQMELLEPLLTRAKNAIEAVAEENGYTYIFDAGVGMLLYYEKGENILPMVKAKLGLE